MTLLDEGSAGVNYICSHLPALGFFFSESRLLGAFLSLDHLSCAFAFLLVGVSYLYWLTFSGCLSESKLALRSDFAFLLTMLTLLLELLFVRSFVRQIHQNVHFDTFRREDLVHVLDALFVKGQAKLVFAKNLIKKLHHLRQSLKRSLR